MKRAIVGMETSGQIRNKLRAMAEQWGNFILTK